MSKIDVEFDDPAIAQIGVESLTDFYKTMAIGQLHLPGLSRRYGNVATNTVIETINRLIEPLGIVAITGWPNSICCRCRKPCIFI
jgi:hypothetical protein